MTASIRSRVTASAVAFGLGFAAANVGLLLMPARDHVAWLLVAGVLIGTAGVGVGFADTRHRLSIWAVLGVEAFAVFTLVPLVWMFRVATAPHGDPRTTLVPQAVDWAAFGRVLDSEAGRAMAHSLVASALATLVAVPVGFLAGYTLVTRKPPGHRQVRRRLPALVLAPLVAWTVPMADQARRLGFVDMPVSTAVALLVVTVPLASWLSVGLCEQVRWDAIETIRSAGASARDLRRLALAPHFVPAILAVAAATFVAGCLDFVAGFAVSAVHGPLSVTLLGTGDLRETAAAGLIWLALTGGLVAVFAPVLTRLVGRS